MLTIKNLRYVNKTSAFKISDTTTKIKLQGLLGSTPVTFQDADEVSIRIKNNSGYLMQVKPKILSDGIVSFSSKELELLPVGSYAMELWQDNQAGTNIYPSEGFLRFTINKNATEFKGDSMSTITLHIFEERIDKLEKDLRAKADNGDFDGEKGEPGDKGDPGKDATNNDPNAVHVSGNQAISGVKNFIDTPTINGNKVLDDSLQIGGRNYLLGTSDNWQHYKGWGYWIAFNFEIGQEYTISVRLKDIKVSKAALMIRLEDKDGNFLDLKGNVINDREQLISHWSDNTDEELHSATITIPKNTYKAKALIGTRNANTELDYRCFKTEKGTKATDWTPAPEDIGTSQPIMSGNYGLRVTSGGFQKTTDGGVTWTTANI